MFPTEIYRACTKALQTGMPFACCRMPGEQEILFFAEDSCIEPYDTTKEYLPAFEIGRWLAPYSERTVIRGKLSPSDILALPDSYRYPVQDKQYNPYPSVTREDYIKAVEAIAESCRRREGKTVYSRTINSGNPHLDIVAAASGLFDMFPETFGFLYNHPTTGCWIGATPETLLSADLLTGRFSTMALAGTRPISEASCPWDEKNLRENLFVADFFAQRFGLLDLDFKISAPLSIDYGPIQHLRRDITGHLPLETSSHTIGSVIDLINPTPALCGTPTETALHDLALYEPHSRDCYGGFVALHTPTRFDAFVNLRSAHLSTDSAGLFTIFAGGGITGASIPSTEYSETSAKAAPLLSLLTAANTTYH